MCDLRGCEARIVSSSYQTLAHSQNPKFPPENTRSFSLCQSTPSNMVCVFISDVIWDQNGLIYWFKGEIRCDISALKYRLLRSNTRTV